MKKMKLVKLLTVLLILVMFLQNISITSISLEPNLVEEKLPSLEPIENQTPSLELENGKVDPEEIYIEKELEWLRKENVKHFKMSDGSRTAAIYPLPVHYFEDDKWIDIDNSLSISSNETITTEGYTPTEFAQTVGNNE